MSGFELLEEQADWGAVKLAELIAERDEAIDERDRARSLAVRLEQELAEVSGRV